MASSAQEETNNDPQDSTLTYIDGYEVVFADELSSEDEDDCGHEEMHRRLASLCESFSELSRRQREENQLATEFDDGVNQVLELLKNCKMINLQQVKGVNECPSVRACPTCGLMVEHNKTGSKNIICPRCRIEFCFVCLKLTRECLETSCYFIACSDGVAPRQTSIPEWHRD